jgi:hypothetical protein
LEAKLKRILLSLAAYPVFFSSLAIGYAGQAPTQPQAASRIVYGEEAEHVKRLFVRDPTGLVADGVPTPVGLGSGVFGTYKGQPASCIYPWGKQNPYSCEIGANLSVD